MKLWQGGLFLALAGILGSVLGLSEPWPERIVVLSVGQGDCALVQSRGRNMLIDVGPGGSSREGDIVAHLERYGVDGVDLVLLSHPDADHINGLPAIHKQFPSARVVISKWFATDQKFANEFQASGVSSESLIQHAEGHFGDFSLRIDCPRYVEGRKSNDNTGSMFVRMALGEASYLTTGDAPSATEDAELAEGTWASEILHVSHHGSRYSSDAGWLRAIHPELAVISCGKGNRYGHPHPDTLARLHDAGVPVARTDTDGDLELDFADGKFKLKK